MEQTADAVGGVRRIHHDLGINIDEQHTKGDRHQQKRFKIMPDRKIKKYTGHCDHQIVAPGKIQEGCLMNQIGQSIGYI